MKAAREILELCCWVPMYPQKEPGGGKGKTKANLILTLNPWHVPHKIITLSCGT